MSPDPSKIQWDTTSEGPNEASIKWDTQEPALEPKKPRTVVEELKRQLGLSARLGANILTGTGGVIGDFGVGAYNAATGSKLPMPSEAQAKMLTQLGLPEAEGLGEKAVQFAGNLIGGSMDPLNVAARVATAAKNVPAAFGSVGPTANAKTVQELHDAGLKLPPTSMGGGAGSRAMEGFGGKAHLNTQMRAENQPIIQKWVAAETNLDPRNLTDEAINAANKALSNEGYQPIRDLGTLKLYGQSPASRYGMEIRDIERNYRTIDKAGAISDRVRDLKTRTMNADDLLERISQLRSDATDAFRSNETNYGKALRQLADATEDQISRNLTSPLLVQQYRAARTQIAKNLALRDMLVDPDNGLVSTAKAAKLREDGVKLTGGLLKAAKAGDKPFVHATDAPMTGQGTPFNWGDTLYAGGGLGLGGLIGGATGGIPGAAIGAGAVAAGRYGARRAVMSDRMQAALAKGMQENPSILGPMMQGGMLQAPDDITSLFQY